MSALIKQGSADVRRAFAPERSDRQTPAPTPTPHPREAELARLREKADQLEAALVKAEAAKDDARASGREAGLAEAERDEAVRIALLEAALADAAQAFEARLASLDGLAPLLARAALEKLCVPPENWTALIEAIIARQLGAMRRSALIALHVSREDFDSAATLPGTDRTEVEFDPGLASGTARIELKLGQIDLDVREQWGTLATLLDEMAEGA